jgi:glycosyltransferase involved in cell wall biosynthesis
MKCCHIITSLEVGGAQVMLHKLLSTMNRHAFQPTVICLTSIGQMGRALQEQGIPVYGLNMRSGRLDLRAFVQLIKVLREQEPRIVQTWLYHADLLGGVAAKIVGIRHIAWNIRHTNLDWDKNRWHTLGAVRICAYLSKTIPELIICNSQAAAETHQRVGYVAHKFRIIPNGFDVVRFVPDDAARLSVRSELGIGPRSLLVGMVGRFHPQKNQQGFLEAAALLAHRGLDLRYVMAGAELQSSNRELTAVIDRLGLTGQVHLLGSRTDMPRIMASLDLLVLPSHGEGFPNVVGEAMSAGVPCVATDVGDARSLLGEGGLVVRPNDPEALAGGMFEILSLPSEKRRALGELARERIKRMFSIQEVARRYETLYLELAGSVAV